jgi:hypothetical protein
VDGDPCALECRLEDPLGLGLLQHQRRWEGRVGLDPTVDGGDLGPAREEGNPGDGDAGRHDLVGQSGQVEQLERARVQLGGARERAVHLGLRVDDVAGGAVSRELECQREPDGPGAHDEDVRVHAAAIVGVLPCGAWRRGSFCRG